MPSSLYELIAEGDFPKVYQQLSKQLQSHPEDKEVQAGFYFSGWWCNRTDVLKRKQLGLELASYLNQQWQESKKIAQEKKLFHTRYFVEISKFILGQTAKNYYLYYQSKTTITPHATDILQLGEQLLKIGSHKQGLEILKIAQPVISEKVNKQRAYFLLGEAYCLQKDSTQVNRGINLIRQALLVDPVKIQEEWIISPLLLPLLSELRDIFSDQPKVALYWFPARFQLLAFSYTLTMLNKNQFANLDKEVDRLQNFLGEIRKEFKEKTFAILSFYILNLIYDLKYHQENATQVAVYMDRLRNIMPQQLYELILSVP